MSVYGNLHVSTAVATSPAVIGTYQKLAGTTTLDEADGVDMPADGALRYTGSTARPFMVEASFTVQAAADLVATFAVAKNGVADAESEIELTMKAALQKMHASVRTLVTLSQNDKVEIWVKSTVLNTITAHKLRLSMVAV